MSEFIQDLKTESVVGRWMVDHFWSYRNGQRVDDIKL